MFKTLAHSELKTYSEFWAIQNPGISEPEAYSETSTMECLEKQLSATIIFASYHHFRNSSFSSPLVHEINMIFLMQG